MDKDAMAIHSRDFESSLKYSWLRVNISENYYKPSNIEFKSMNYISFSQNCINLLIENFEI